jgi:hypothetical protein
MGSEEKMALDTEFRYFESIRGELLQHHEGKYALIIGSELVGTFDHSEEAYKAGIEQRGNVPMLIKRVSKDDPVEMIPAMTVGLFRANL